MSEIISEMWKNWTWYFHDFFVAVFVFLFVFVVWKLSRREYWRVAFREVCKRRLAVISFFILCVYGFIALLDSVGYHPPVRDDSGEIRLKADGKVLYDDVGLSLLDKIFTRSLERTEKTYSAPFADKQFTKTTMVNPEGEVVRDYPDLKYPGTHPFGTDKVGVDVVYLALKGIRTGIIIGALTTLLAIPFAIFFGVMAGYFGGWVDDMIQYIYTVLASIPWILLVAAFIMLFGRGLFQLCIIMGVTSWTGLCRIIRGETLKLRELEYVQAAEALGVSRMKTMLRHIVPNILHIVVITAVLGFSGRVLAEAVLTYVGVGVGPDTISWGRMINDARFEFARDPIIWWKLVTAFVFMMGLVLPANIFGDALRDALDPRLRTR